MKKTTKNMCSQENIEPLTKQDYKNYVSSNLKDSVFWIAPPYNPEKIFGEE